ncbi:hypothetical protein L7F22_014635 [Adiantum nelumboides]|nr:hypothetical protein [Adiantum nelumboides]
MPAPPADLKYNSLEEIEQIHKELRDSFQTGKTAEIGFRKHQLKQLSFLLNDNVEAIVDAIGKDLGRCRFESVFAEITLCANECIDAYENIEKWAKADNKWFGVVWSMHAPKEIKEPKGTVLVMGAWNYPISVQVGPLVAALAAGNTAVLKPSEVAAHSAKLLAELWPKYMDPSMSRIINGAIPETTKLLDLRWEHILYTGNGNVGRIVAEKAAKWLCPTTLELGGKSPVFIDEHADFNIAAHRLLWAKSINCGQTCIAPDYIVCTKQVQDKLVEHLKRVQKEFWPQSPRKSKDYGRIINERHFARLSGLIDKTKGSIVLGGDRDEADRFFEPTVVADVKPGDSVMSDEIFGPILPILVVKDIEEAIDYVNDHDQPLALYAFVNAKNMDHIVKRTRSGGVVQGDLMLHYTVPLTFGGTGPSGYGAYHGRAGFDTFSHTRCMVSAPATGVLGKITEALMASRYPPYTDGNLKMLRMLLGRSPGFKRPEKVYTGKESGGLFSRVSALFTLLAIVAAVAYGRQS